MKPQSVKNGLTGVDCSSVLGFRGGPREAGGVPYHRLNSTEQRKPDVGCSAQEVKRLLPLVRFNLMETQFFRQEVSSLFFI